MGAQSRTAIAKVDEAAGHFKNFGCVGKLTLECSQYASVILGNEVYSYLQSEDSPISSRRG